MNQTTIFLIAEHWDVCRYDVLLATLKYKGYVRIDYKLLPTRTEKVVLDRMRILNNIYVYHLELCIIIGSVLNAARKWAELEVGGK